ncbi:hypothetical protein CHS0354_036109 [Potamilus streckersoni]|uniref:Uncharacterized protein n=1 Tax=Potamilus streckersoni TaxID=2493646 RepID=A0AAE0T3N0_9BIVA|nr:hypothetical protein CHS0354_036109 [Potamilus streckersoni]
MLDKVKTEKMEHECQIKKLERSVEDLTFSLEESRIHQDKQQHDYSELQAGFQKYKDDVNVKSMEDSQTKVILTQEVEELKNIIDGKDEIIGQLNNEMTHTKDVLEKMQSLLDETRSKLEESEMTLRQVQSQSEATQLYLEEKMSQQENENKSLQDKINCLLRDMECLQKQLKETQEDHSHTCQKLKEGGESLEKLTAEKENLEKCLNHKVQEKQDLLEKLDHSDNALVSLKTEKVELEQNLSQALFRLETSSTDLTDLSKQLEEAESKCKVLNEMLDQIRLEKTEHDLQITKLERNVEDLTFSLEESRVHQDKQQCDYSDLQAEFQKYKDDANVRSVEEMQTKAILTQKVEEQKNIIDGKDEIIGQLKNEMMHSKDTQEKTQSLLDETRSKLKESEMNLNQVQSDSEATKLNLETEISQQEKENKSLQDNINCLLREVECLKKMLEDIQDKYNMVCLNLKESKDSCEKLTSEKEELEKCLSHKDQEKQDLLNKLDHSNDVLVSLKTEKTDLEHSLSQALFKLETMSTDFIHLNKQLEEAENKCRHLNEMLDKVNAEKMKLDCQVKELERNMGDLTFSLEESKVHQDRQLHDYSDLQAEFQKYKDDTNVRSVEETQIRSILTLQMEELKNIIDGKNEDIRQLNNEMTHTKDAMEKIQLVLDKTRSKLEETEMTLNQVQSDSEAAKLNLGTEISQQEKENKSLQDKINCLLSDMECLKNMLEDTQDKYNMVCLNLKESKDSCEKLTSEKEELEKCLSHKDQEKQDLLNKLDHSNDDLVSLKTEKTDLEHSLSQALFKLETTSADISDLNKQLEETENKCKFSSEMLDKVNAEKMELDCKVKTLERNIEDLIFCFEESRVHQEKQQHDYSELQAKFQKYKDEVNISSVEEMQTKAILTQKAEELKNIIVGKDEVIQQLNNEITRSKDEVGAKNIMLETVRVELNAIDASFKQFERDSSARKLELEEEIVKQKNEIEVLQGRYNDLSSELDNLTRLKEDLRDKLEEKSLKLKDSISALEQLTIENMEISKKFERKETDNQELLEKLDVLGKQISLMKMETADKKQTLSEAEFKLETAMDDLKTLNNQYELLLDANKIKSDEFEALVLQKSELQSRLIRLEHDVEELKTRLEEGSRKRQELEKSNTRLQAELNILKDKTSHSQVEAAEIYARQAQEVEELKNVKYGKEREILHLFEELKHKEEKLQVTLDKLEDVTKCKCNLENELTIIQTQSKESNLSMQLEIWNLQNNLKNLEEQFQKKEKEYEILKENESMLSYKLGEGESKLLEKQADLEELKHKRIFLEKHVEVLEKDKEEMVLQEESLRKKINDIETENIHNRQLVGELQNVIEEKGEEVSKLDFELNAASEKIEKMQNQLDISRQDWKEKDSTVIEIRAELEETQIKFQEDIRVLQKDKSDLEKKLEKLTTENSILISEQTEGDIELSITVGQLTEKSADMDRLINEKTGLEQQILLGEKNQEELMDKFYQVKAELEDKKAQMIMLEQKLNETKFELETAHSSLKFNHAKVEEAQSTVAGLKEQLENSLQKNQHLKMSNIELEKEIEELRFKLIDAENSGNKLENKVGNIQQEMEDLKDNCSQKNLEVYQIKAELNNEISELKSILGSKERALADLTAELEHLKDNFETKQNQFSTLNDNVGYLLVEKAALQKELSEIRTDMREKETENHKLKSKIETLNAELQEAKDMLGKKTKELEDTCVEIAYLKTNVELENISFGESFQKANVQNKYLTNKVSELQLQLDTAKKENDDLCSRLSTKEAKWMQKSEDMDQMVAEKNSLCGEVMGLEKELEQYRQTMMSSSAEQLALKDEIRSLQLKLIEINNEAEMLKETKAMLEKNLEKVECDHKAARERLYHLESELTVFEGHVKTLNAELEEKNLYIADINKMKEDLSNSLTMKENEYAKLADVISIAKLNEKELKIKLGKNLEDTQRLLAEKDAEIVIINEKLIDLIEKCDNAQTKIKYLEIQVEKSNAELVVLKTDQGEWRNQAEERTDLQHEDNKSLQETIVVVSNERNKALEEKEAVKSKISKMEKELEQYICDLETIRKERDELAEQLAGAEEDCRREGKNIDFLKHELCAFKSDKQDVKGKLEEVECELTKTRTEKCELAEKLIALEDQKSELKETIDKLNAEFSALQAERVDFENKLGETKRDLEEAVAINQSLKNQLQQSVTEYKTLQKQMHDLASDKEGLKAEHQKVKADNERISTEMKDVKRELTEPMEIMTQENRDLQNKIFNMEHSLLNRCQEIRSLEKEREEMEVEFKTIQLSCHDLQKTIESLESKKVLLVAEIRELKSIDSHQQVETERLIAEKLNLEKMLSEKEAETLTLNNNFEESKSQLTEYEEELKQKNRELVTFMSKVEQLSSEYDGLSKENRDRLRHLQDKAVLIQDLKSQLSDQEHKLRNSEESLAEWKMRYEQVKTEVQNLRKDCVQQGTESEMLTANVMEAIKELTTERDRLSQKLNEFTEIWDKLKTEVHESKTEAEELRGKLTLLSHDLKESEKERKQADAQVQKLKQELENLQTEIENLNVEKEDLQNLTESTCMNKMEIEEKLKEVKRELADEKNKSEEMKQNITTLANENKTLSEKNSEAEDLISVIQMEKCELQNQKKELDNFVSNLKEERKNLQEKVKSLESTIENFKEFMESLEIENNSLESSKADLLSQIQSLNIRIKVLETLAAEEQEKRESLSQQQMKWLTEQESLNRKLDALNAKLLETEKKCEDAYRRECSLQEENKLLETKIKGLEKKIQGTSGHADLESRVRAAESELAQVKLESICLNQRVATHEREKKDLLEQFLQMEDQKAVLEKSKSALEQQLTVASKEKKDLETEIQRLNSALETTRMNQQKSELALSGLEHDLVIVRENRDCLAEELEKQASSQIESHFAWKKDEKEAETKILNLQSKIMSMKTFMEKLQDQHSVELEEAQAGHIRDLEKLKDEHGKIMASREAELQEEIKSIQASMYETQCQLNDTKEKLEEKERQAGVEGLTQKHNELLKKWESRCARLQSQLSAEKSTVAKLKAQMKPNTSLSSSLLSVTSGTENMNTQVEQLQKNFNETKIELERAEKELSGYMDKCLNLQKDSQKIKEENGDLKTRVKIYYDLYMEQKASHVNAPKRRSGESVSEDDPKRSRNNSAEGNNQGSMAKSKAPQHSPLSLSRTSSNEQDNVDELSSTGATREKSKSPISNTCYHLLNKTHSTNVTSPEIPKLYSVSQSPDSTVSAVSPSEIYTLVKCDKSASSYSTTISKVSDSSTDGAQYLNSGSISCFSGGLEASSFSSNSSESNILPSTSKSVNPFLTSSVQSKNLKTTVSSTFVKTSSSSSGNQGYKVHGDSTKDNETVVGSMEASNQSASRRLRTMSPSKDDLLLISRQALIKPPPSQPLSTITNSPKKSTSSDMKSDQLPQRCLNFKRSPKMRIQRRTRTERN